MNEIDNAYKVYLEEGNLIVVDFLIDVPEENGEDVAVAEAIGREVNTILRRNPTKQFKVLASTLALGKDTGNVSKEARGVYVAIISNDQIEKTAFVSASSFLTIVATFVFQAAGRSNKVKFFKEKEKALGWLHEGDDEDN
ncbi:hypothetical protein KKH43_00755 [Patescibacteria group bacterium]|nr:hypothetical protein [Patescibacteria group bacterium]